MVTPFELAKKTMTEEKKKSARNDIFAYYIGRPISYVLTMPFLAINMKPNTVSFLSFFPSVAGFILLSFGTEKWVQICGVICFILWNFMDGVDGNIARYTRQTSTLGTLWDAASGYFAMMLMYFSAGVSVVNMDGGPFSGYVPDYYYIVLSGLTALLTIYSRLVMCKKQALFNDESAYELGDKANYTFVRKLFLNLTSPSGFIQIILLFCVWLDLTRFFAVFYFAVQLLATVYSLNKLLRDN